MPFDYLYVSEWPETFGARCPTCLAIATNGEDVRRIEVGVTPHIFRITDLPVQGRPEHSAIQALCDGVSIGFKQYLPSDQLLTALEAIDKGAATQGKANVALDILSGL